MEQDEDLALVRQLHLELNGFGRRNRRNAVHPPAKKIKREAPVPSSEAKKTSSFSQSASDSRSGGKTGKGTLKRLIKKPDSDSVLNQSRAEEDLTTQQNVEKEALEPQISTKIISGSNAAQATEGDVGSRGVLSPPELTSPEEIFSEETCANRARLTAQRDENERNPRVKCFYQGGRFGVSLDPTECCTRQAFDAALQETLMQELHLNSSKYDIFVFDSKGERSWCGADDPDAVWNASLQGAKRIYFTESQALSAS